MSRQHNYQNVHVLSLSPIFLTSFYIHCRPTRIPTPPPALGSNTNSFPIELVLNGISPYLIISENMKLKIATFIGNVVTANVDPEITLIGVSLQLDHMGRNLVVDQQYRMLEDWFILPLVVTLSYPSLRDDAFALVVVALTENIGVVQNYLQNDVGGVFCGMTGIVVEHNFVELDNAASTPLNQISNAVPWWVWLVLAVGLLVVIVVFFGSLLYVKSKGESEKKSARSNAMQGVRARYSKRQASTRRASPKGKRETHHRSKSSIHRRQHSHKHHSPMLRTRQQPPLMLPPPEQPYPMLPPSHEPYLMILPPSSPNKPPAQVRSDSYISDVTVSIYPQGAGISTVQNAAVESTALVLYDSSQNPKSPDPEERILKSQEKASNRQYRPDPKECARRSQNAILRVNNGPNREQDDNTLLVFSPAENRAPT